LANLSLSEDVGLGEEAVMSSDIIGCARAEALFVSPVQPSDCVTAELVRAEVSSAVRRHGSRGCAALVAYEFGEHPDIAVARMRWAAAVVRAAFPHRRVIRSVHVLRPSRLHQQRPLLEAA
jgi:hypothetical protein